MFIPFLSTRSKSESTRPLFRRKGGGGGGRGGGSTGRGGGSTGKGGSTGESTGEGEGGSTGHTSSSSGAGRTTSRPISESGTSKTATTYGKGGGKVTTIPAGQPFAGRAQGGGTREQVFGSRAYGSGYPGVGGLGVAGRNFPFFFWPIVWGGAAGVGAGAYLHSNEYGSPDNSSRPGGAQGTAAFQSNTTNTIFRVVSDNTTVAALIDSINANCSSNLATSSSTSPSPYNASASTSPQPEQAVQYYRASSVVLTLDGYNNTDALTGDANSTNTPLPSGIDTTLLQCLNQTIGLSVPLISGAAGQWSTPGMGTIGLFSVFWFLLFGMY